MYYVVVDSKTEDVWNISDPFLYIAIALLASKLPKGTRNGWKLQKLLYLVKKCMKDVTKNILYANTRVNR